MHHTPLKHILIPKYFSLFWSTPINAGGGQHLLISSIYCVVLYPFNNCIWDAALTIYLQIIFLKLPYFKLFFLPVRALHRSKIIRPINHYLLYNHRFLTSLFSLQVIHIQCYNHSLKWLVLLLKYAFHREELQTENNKNKPLKTNFCLLIKRQNIWANIYY